MKKTIYATDRVSRDEATALLGNSSGMILSEEDNAITVGYVDFDVSAFGGRDYECFYHLDPQNAGLFKEALRARYAGDLFDMCVAAFGIKFSNSRFEDFCAAQGISYVKNTY